MRLRLRLLLRSLPNSFWPRKSPEEWRKKSTSFEGWVRGAAIYLDKLIVWGNVSPMNSDAYSTYNKLVYLTYLVTN